MNNDAVLTTWVLLFVATFVGGVLIVAGFGWALIAFSLFALAMVIGGAMSANKKP